MTVQNKLWSCGSHEFWADIDRSISFWVRDLITGRDVARLAVEMRKAGVERCTDSLLYKWANPNAEQTPSLKQFLLLVRICENCGPIESINEACGKVGVPDDDFLAGVKYCSRREIEVCGRGRLRPWSRGEVVESNRRNPEPGRATGSPLPQNPEPETRNSLLESLAWLDYCLSETQAALEAVQTAALGEMGAGRLGFERYHEMCETAARIITLLGRVRKWV